jgi:hypothetical protein
MLRGSLITLKRRCGTKTCRCASGVLHESPALSCTIGGKSHVITLDGETLALARKALARYTKACERLERRCEQGMTLLRQKVDARKAERKQPR